MPKADNDDTSVSPTVEAVDTSTNEDTLDTDVDDDLEDDTTSFDDYDDDDTDESDDSEAEELDDSDEQDTEPAESEEESKEDDEQSDEEESSDEEANEEDTTSEDVKKHNAEMAAKRIAEKREREEALAKSQQDFLEAAADDQDYALRQLQIEAYNTRVERTSSKLENGIERAYNDISLLRDGSPEVKEELIRRLDDFELKHVRRAQNGDPIEVTGDVYEYLKKEADSLQRILSIGARKEAKAKVKAKTRTESLPSRTPKEPKVDPDLAAFDEAFGALE